MDGKEQEAKETIFFLPTIFSKALLSLSFM